MEDQRRRGAIDAERGARRKDAVKTKELILDELHQLGVLPGNGVNASPEERRELYRRARQVLHWTPVVRDERGRVDNRKTRRAAAMDWI